MPKAGVSHNVTLTSGGITRGYMLYPQKDGRRYYSIEDAESIRPTTMDTAAALRAASNLGEFSLAYRQYWVQSDWRGGIGGLLGRLDPLRHGGSRNIDMSSSGRLQIARKLTATSESSTPAAREATGFATGPGSNVWVFFREQPYIWNFPNRWWNFSGVQGGSNNSLIRNGVQFGNVAYAPSWGSAPQSGTSTYTGRRYLYRTTGAYWTRISGTDANTNAPKYLAVADGKLWGGFWFEGSKHHVRSTTDGTAVANWSSLTAVGDASAEITNLIGDHDTLLVCKQDGIWALYPDGSTRNLIPEYQQMSHPHHFRAGVTWNGHVLVSLGGGGMLDIWAGRVYDVSFKYSLPGAPHLHGRVVAMAADAERIYCMVHDPDTSAQDKLHILGGYWAGFGDEAPSWRWQHLAELRVGEGVSVEILQTVSLFTESSFEGSAGHRRLWVGTGQIAPLSGLPLRAYFIPFENDAESEYNMTTDTGPHVRSSRYESVVFDANTPNITKLWLDVQLKTRGLISTGTAQIQYRVDEQVDSSVPFTDIGTPLQNNNRTVTLPAGTSGKTLQVAIEFSQQVASGSTTPDIIEVVVSYYLRPTRLETIPLRLYIAEGQVLLNGGFNSRAKSDLAQLRTWMDQAAAVTVVDAEKNTQTVVLVPGSLKVRELVKEPGRQSEYLVEVLLAEV